MKETCQTCKKEFEMGETGTIDGCDECLGIKRDRKGYAWFSEQTHMTLCPAHRGSEKDCSFVVTREEAFK